MSNKKFNYEKEFMGVRKKKPGSYRRSFNQDYRLRSLVKTVLLQKGRILDIGSGGGLLTESLPYYYPEAAIYGCDVSNIAIRYAKKFGSGKVKYDVIRNNRFPYRNNYFDVCICFDVLEHVPDAQFFLSEVKRVLKRGGKFFLIVPCEGQPLTYTWVFQKFKLGHELTFKYFGHIHPEFTHRYVLTLLKKNGFQVRETFYSEHIFFQLLFFCIFYIPKALLQFLLGEERAKEYNDSNLITSPKEEKELLMMIRKIWSLLFNSIIRYPMYLETILFRKVPFTAWKIHVISRNSKK